MADRVHDYYSKDIENLMNNLKSTFFDVIATNQKKISDLEDKIINATSVEEENMYRDAWARYHETLKDIINLVSSFSDSMKRLDESTYEYEQLMSVVKEAKDGLLNQENKVSEVQDDLTSEVVDSQVEEKEEINENVIEEAPEEVTSVEETAPQEEAVIPEEVVAEVPTEEVTSVEETPTEEVVAPVVEEAPREEAVIPEKVVAEVPTEEVTPVEETPAEEVVAPIVEEAPVEAVVIPEEPVAEAAPVETPVVAEVPAEPTSTPVEDDKVVYINEASIDGKAIMVTQAQIAKLRASKDTQKALLDGKNNVTSQPVETPIVAEVPEPPAVSADTVTATVEEDKEKQVNDMLAQAKMLYEQGKVAEAEALSNEVSVLSKKINTAA